jgi:hypothetical protein
MCACVCVCVSVCVCACACVCVSYVTVFFTINHSVCVKIMVMVMGKNDMQRFIWFVGGWGLMGEVPGSVDTVLHCQFHIETG